MAENIPTRPAPAAPQIANAPPITAFPPRIPTDGVSVIDADANETRSLFGCLPILNAMPSWLVSLVLHLLALIVFASLILPPSNRLGIPTLFIGFSDPDPHPDSIEPTILLDPTNSPEPSVDESAVPNDQDQPSPPQQDTNQPSEDGGPPSPAAKKKAMAIAVSLKPFGRWAASLTQKQHELHAEHDKVVDRFIAYDLGRLRGSAGRKALQEFQALGTTAIPALVRGVNKSAQYTGSCPVSVISSKLASELENAKNQGFIRYAIDHLGDDVAWNMPHANRVIALRDKIQKKYGETVRQTDLLVDSMDLPKPIADRTKNLVKLRIKNITNRLAKSRDEDEQLACMAALAVRYNDIRNRADLGIVLAERLRSESESNRNAAATLLSKLKPGKSFGSEPDDSDLWKLHWKMQTDRDLFLRSLMSSDRPYHEAATRLFLLRPLVLTSRQKSVIARQIIPKLNSSSSEVADRTHKVLKELANNAPLEKDAAIWKAYWDEYTRVEIDEPISNSRYRSAKALSQKGNHQAARKYFRKIIEEFPKTDAAVLSRQQLDQYSTH